MLLTFCGAAGTVTGSCYWLQIERCQFLVDCGMFQGSNILNELNYGPFPFNPKKLDFVLLTNSELGHHDRTDDQDNTAKVDNQERFPSVLTGNIGKSPHVPQTHRGSDCRKDEAGPGSPAFGQLLMQDPYDLADPSKNHQHHQNGQGADRILDDFV